MRALTLAKLGAQLLKHLVECGKSDILRFPLAMITRISFSAVKLILRAQGGQAFCLFPLVCFMFAA